MHIVHAIEHKEWPVSVNFSAGEELDIPQNEKECSEVITITTDHGVSRSMVSGNNMSASKKRKRHIAIDVETERGNFDLRHSFNSFYNYCCIIICCFNSNIYITLLFIAQPSFTRFSTAVI